MRIRLRKLTVLLLALFMLLSLTGCEELDYREAVQLYNARKYTEAAALFDQLGQYENSAELRIRCDYWVAVDTMVAGDYAAALEQFQALNGFEDSADRVAECKYQLAMAAFEAGDLPTAESYFVDIPEYKQAPECLRQIYWQKFFDSISQKGTEDGTLFTLTREENGRIYTVSADHGETNRLLFSVSATKDMGYIFYDDLTVAVTRESLEGEFTACSTFSMPFNDQEIGSQQESRGKLDIATCNAETVLAVDAFEKNVLDNLGAATSSQNPNDSLMYDAMMENYTSLMTVLPQFLADSGVEIPLADIGFSAMQ